MLISAEQKELMTTIVKESFSRAGGKPPSHIYYLGPSKIIVGDKLSENEHLSYIF
jgi:hypothetical protein